MIAGTEVIIYLFIYLGDVCYLSSNKNQEKMLEAYISQAAYFFIQISPYFTLVTKMNRMLL